MSNKEQKIQTTRKKLFERGNPRPKINDKKPIINWSEALQVLTYACRRYVFIHDDPVTYTNENPRVEMMTQIYLRALGVNDKRMEPSPRKLKHLAWELGIREKVANRYICNAAAAIDESGFRTQWNTFVATESRKINTNAHKPRGTSS